MAEKTEQPTPKKLREARKKGNVAFSRDANGVLTYIVGVALLTILAPRIGRLFAALYRDMVVAAVGAPTEPSAWSNLMHRSLNGGLLIVVIFAFAVAVAGLVLGLAQTQLNVSAENLKPKLNKLNPMKRLKQWFSARGLFEFVKTLFKLFIVFFLGFLVVRAVLGEMLRLHLIKPMETLNWFGKVSTRFLYRVAMVFAVVGAVDFFFQRRQWKKNLMMTKDEVKREFKESEGDPLIKSMRKQVHQQLVSQSVPRAVAAADVVTVNPTHIAVAVQYDRDTMVAPKVTAKGREKMARQIVTLARKYNVPIVRDVELARALYEVELDEYVPEELFEVVAEVLLFAWKMKEQGEAQHTRTPAGGVPNRSRLYLT